MTGHPHDDLAAELHPPRMRLTAVIASVTMLLSIATAGTLYQQRDAQHRTDQRVNANTAVICGAARLRQSIPPVTPLERAMQRYMRPTDHACTQP